MLRTLLASIVGILLSTTPIFATTKKEIVMGFNPNENVDATEANSKLFSEYYQKQTGLKVKTFIASDYTALIEALRAGRVDFAFLPPFSYVKAEEMADAQVLLKAVRNGKAVYYGAIIVRADKGINTIEDLKGKNIAWVDPTSTTGHIVPKAEIMTKIKGEADKFFGKQIYAGSHDSLVLAVANGLVDAGATFASDPEGKEGAWTQFLKDPKEQKKLKAIFVTAPITGDTMATTKKFYRDQKELVDKTVSIIEEMGKSPEGKNILMTLYHMEAMVPAKSSDYDAIRKAAKTLKIE